MNARKIKQQIDKNWLKSGSGHIRNGDEKGTSMLLYFSLKVS
jgi:hypothetical protein